VSEYLFVSARQKMHENFRTSNNGMFAHSVNPNLQLFQPRTNKLFFKSTCANSRLSASMHCIIALQHLCLNHRSLSNLWHSL